jgi:hypothetical protein
MSRQSNAEANAEARDDKERGQADMHRLKAA